MELSQIMVRVKLLLPQVVAVVEVALLLFDYLTVVLVSQVLAQLVLM